MPENIPENRPASDPLGDLPPLRDIIRDHDLRAEKALGQNFLLDLNITDKIARAAASSVRDFNDCTIIEIGPGPGGLTRSLLSAGAKKIVAIEFDARAVAALQSLQHAANGRLDILAADALKADLASLAPAPRMIVANLPYNISTVLLIKWLRDIFSDTGIYRSMTLMFQKEVADRLTAKPHGRDYGRLSVMTQWLCDAGRAFDLPPEAFSPPPKVTSSVMVLKPKPRETTAPQFETMEKILAQAFQQRRKMIRGSLKSLMPHIEKAGLDPTARAENLTVDDYLTLALSVEKEQRG